MTVRDMILHAARILGIEQGVIAYWDDEEYTYEKDAKLLESCFYSVENNLALNYIPLYAEDTLHTSTGRLEYSALEYSPVRIVSVTNEKDEAVPYTIYPKYLKTQLGTFKVTYTYLPPQKELDDMSEFSLLISDMMLVYGILAEYCLAEGRYEDAAEWDKKYKAEIESIFRKRTCQRIRSRRWV